MVKVNKKKPKAKRVIPLTRKEQRKQKKVQLKEKKRLYFSSKTNGKELVAAAAAATAAHSGQAKKKPKSAKKKKHINPDDIPIEELLSGKVDADDDESIDSDFSDAEIEARMPAKYKEKKEKPAKPEPPAKKPKKLQGIQRVDEMAAHKREVKQQKELENKSRKQRIKQLKIENEEEDKVIAKLEKKLKLNKTKDKNRLVRKMFSDGLDFVLDFVLDDDEEKVKWEEKQRRKQERKDQQEREEMGMWSEEDDDDGEGHVGEDNGMSGEDGSDMDDMSGDNDEDDGMGNGSDEDEKMPEEPQFKEDIYGRKRDKNGNILHDNEEENAPSNGKYIPPHQRALLAASAGTSEKQSELIARLRKHCKGLLNRLSEANLHKISTGIKELYMKNSRYNMNDTLTALLTEALIGRTISNERMVQEHMVLLAYLHAQIGSEIGAHFLQIFIEQFDGYVKEIDSLAVEDKRLNNLVLVLCYMYIFKIYEHRLLLEIIARLADSLCEKSIECLLLVFQSVGFKLRKDDPLAFKQMMTSVQQQIANSPLELKENLRLKFMVDILNAVKNNNMNKLPQYDPELAETLRKRLKAMLRNDRYVVTLNITLDDLLRADKVGKWWIVGSAWSGNINEMGTANAAKDDAANNSRNSADAQRYSEKLLALAKTQQMNTAERRNIFCIIMSAADYVDAFEKVLHLSLKDQRTVAYVIIHCCLNEKRSNPYYSHLALKFCQYNRKFQLAFQFASWDRINDIEALTKLQISNLAQFLKHLILSGGLQLSVLKVVDFMQLDKLSFYFMKEIVVALLLASNELEVYEAFERVAKNTKLQQFKQSLRLFMQHFLLQQEASKLKEDKRALLEKRVNYVDKLLAYVDL